MRTKPKIPIDLKEVERLASLGLTLEEIATGLGCSYETLNNRSKENTDIKEAIKRGRLKSAEHVVNKLMEQIDQGNVTATIFYLKAKCGWRDKDAIEVKHSGSIGTTVGIISDKEREALDKYFDENF